MLTLAVARSGARQDARVAVNGCLHGVIRAALAVRGGDADLAPLGNGQRVTGHGHTLQVSAGLMMVIEAVPRQRIRLADPHAIAAAELLAAAQLMLLVPPQPAQDVLLGVGAGVLVAPLARCKENPRVSILSPNLSQTRDYYSLIFCTHLAAKWRSSQQLMAWR